MKPLRPSKAVGSKTGKTAVFPGFCKMELGGGSGGRHISGLTWSVRTRRAGSATVTYARAFFIDIILSIGCVI